MNLKDLAKQIEKLPKSNHIGILQILYKNNKHLINENKNGIHVNFSEVDVKTIEKINDYIQYVFLQQTNLTKLEEQQQQCYKYQIPQK
jgi:hypothetical protein